MPRDCARSTGREAAGLPLDARQREASRSTAMAMAAPSILIRNCESGTEARRRGVGTGEGTTRDGAQRHRQNSAYEHVACASSLHMGSGLRASSSPAQSRELCLDYNHPFTPCDIFFLEDYNRPLIEISKRFKLYPYLVFKVVLKGSLCLFTYKILVNNPSVSKYKTQFDLVWFSITYLDLQFLL